MRKKTEKKNKVYKSKILYKAFRKGYSPETEKLNVPPIASKQQYEGNLGVLGVDNAKGFISFKVYGKLVPCGHGYHAFDRKNKDIWTSPDYGIYQRVYKIRLYNCFRHNSKWVGDEFEILERVTVRELKPRRWRD